MKNFTKLTAAQKRVAIARDAIKQIECKTYKASEGFYVGIGSGVRINQTKVKAMKRCRVCAWGMALLSSVRLFNEFNETNDPSSIENHLSKIFPNQNLRLIEAVFEGWNDGATNNDATLAFYRKHPDNTKRALAIFRNIIRNRGEFKL